MKIKLKNIAELYTGFTQRWGDDSSSPSGFKIIQFKDLSSNSNYIYPKELARIDWTYDSKPHFLQTDSIIITARGNNVKAYLFKGNISDQVVVSNQFIVIELNDNKINPEYLVWYLNHAQQARTHFDLNSRGTTLLMLSIMTLRELNIIVPSLEQQNEVLKRVEDYQEEQILLQRWLRLKNEYNDALNELILLQANKLACSTDLKIGGQ